MPKRKIPSNLPCKQCKCPNAYISLEEFIKYIICPACGFKQRLKEYNLKLN